MEIAEEQPLVAGCPASAVLNNFYLVVKILKEVKETRNKMELSLVNRIFRDAYHVNLRRTHRNLKIEYINLKYRGLAKISITTDRIYINHCRFKISNLDNYFHFLKNIAKVKIWSIVVKGLWQLTPSIQTTLYESITVSLIGNDRDSLKKLVGMDEICPGNCEESMSIPKKCVEYGPLRIENIQKSFTKPRVFEKLIVPEYLLDDIANFCVESTQSKDDCLQTASVFIPSNISCKTLILKMSERRNEWIDPEMNDEMQERRRILPNSDHQAMPREIIEIMLKQWNVQSVVLKFVYKAHRGEFHSGEWTRKGWFNRLCFTDPYTSIRESDPSLKIKEVFVDLTDSLRCDAHLRQPNLNGLRTNSYVHLPSKIRRVFLNDRLKIQFSHYRTSLYDNISRVVGDIMQIISTEALQNLEVEIMNMYMVWKTDIDFLDELSKKEPRLRPVVFKDYHISELQKRINVSHKKLIREDQPLVGKEWIGKCFLLTNKEWNSNIKWTMFENDHLPDKDSYN